MNFVLLIFLFNYFIISLTVKPKYEGINDLNEFYDNNKNIHTRYCRCPNFKEHVPFIENKRDLEPDELTWFGTFYTKRAIKNKNYYVPLCSGALINRIYVLTSASCMKNIILANFPRTNSNEKFKYVEYLRKTLFFAAGGSRDLNDIYLNKSINSAPVENIEYHPNYNSTLGRHDLAIVKLGYQLTKSYSFPNIDTNIEIACLSHTKNNDYTRFNEHFYYTLSYQTSEFAKLELELFTVKERFNKDTDIEFQPPSTRSIDPNSNVILANGTKPLLLSQVPIHKCEGDTDDYFFYCTKSPKGKQYTSCPTDGGSPLFYYDKFESRLVIVGINNMPGNRFFIDQFLMSKEGSDSRYKECGTRSFNRFTPVHDEMEWIIATTKQICLQPEVMRKRSEYCNCENKDYTEHVFFEDSHPEQRSNNIKGRIVNGTRVSQRDFRYAAFIFYTILKESNDKKKRIRHFYFLCSATIINRFYALSAQHCWDPDGGVADIWKPWMSPREPLNKKIYYVGAGSDHSERSINNNDTFRRRVSDVYSHPKYVYSPKNLVDENFKSEYDMCLVEVDSLHPFFFDSTTKILPACIQDFDPRGISESLRYVFAIGYGLTKEYTTPRRRMSTLQIDPRDNNIENSYYENSQLYSIRMQYAIGNITATADNGMCPLTEYVICMKSSKGSVCQGDSGSGFIRYDTRRSRFYVAGALSMHQTFIDDEIPNIRYWCDPESIAGYSSIYHNLDFIKSVIGHDACWTENDPYFNGDS